MNIIVPDTSLIDYDTLSSYTLIVTTTDGGGLTDTARVVIFILSANEHHPDFTATGQQITIDEDEPVGTSLYT